MFNIRDYLILLDGYNMSVVVFEKKKNRGAETVNNKAITTPSYASDLLNVLCLPCVSQIGH